MLNVKSVQANNDQKLYQHQMLLSESKFNLQSINISESDLNSKLKSKVNQNLIKKMIFIQNQIIVENQMNQLYIDIQMTIKQNRRTYQDINLNNC
jgi:hypothetical protein